MTVPSLPSVSGDRRQLRPRVAVALGVVQDTALILIAAVFVAIHLRLVLAGHFGSILFATEQGVLVVLFLARRKSLTTSSHVSDWLVAAVGGWLPLAFQPQSNAWVGAAAVGMSLQFVGLTATVICLTALGRSFGVVAANRGLKANGPYRWVRHPIYASHLVTNAGFLIANWWWGNGLLFGVWAVAQIARIVAEERVLHLAADYTSYRRRVRWRLVPGLY